MKVKRSTRNRSRFVRGLLCIGFAVLALLSFLAPASAATTFTVSKESARHKCSTGDVTFTVDFSRQPDFVTTDAEGRQADSFQYYIVGDPSLPYPQNYDSIIRGEEIDLTSGLLPIRNAYPPDEIVQNSGGWGTVRALVPFTLHNNRLKFSVPLSQISDHPASSAISYHLETYEFGSMEASIDNSVRIKCNG